MVLVEAIWKIGRPVVETSFIPSVSEGVSVIFIAHYLLDISFIAGGMLGFILATVSSAILLPRMLDLVHRGIDVAKNIPTLLLAGSATDNAVDITLFSAFLGILTGLITETVLLFAFKKWDFTDTEKLLITLVTGILLNAFGEIMQGVFHVVGLV